MKKKLFYCLVFSLIAARASAGEKLKDEGEFSYVSTDGNSEITTLSAKNRLEYRFSDVLTGSWKVSALNSVNEEKRSIENYSSELRADYSLNEKSYIGTFGGWKKERFVNLDAQYYAGLVYGYKFLSGPKNFLKSEAGLDYVIEEYYDDPGSPLVDESAIDKDYLRGRAFCLYEFQFAEKTKFSQSLEYLHDFEDSENYNINSVTALIASLTNIFSLKTSYELKYDNQPASETSEDTDTILSVALLFNY